MTATTKPTTAELMAIEAQFVLDVADAAKRTALRRYGLLPAPPASVIDELARREAAAKKPAGL